MIDAQDLIDSYDGDTPIRYLTKGPDGKVSAFLEKPKISYIEMDNENEDLHYWGCPKGNINCFGRLKITEFEGKPWDECIYKAKVDESKWVGKLVWVWQDDNDNETIAILDDYKKGKDEPYKVNNQDGVVFWFKHCRPVKRDEVEFVE